jgi:hypothetical protein
MNRRKTNFLLIILAVSLVVLFLLAAGLRQIEFQPGEEFNLQKDLPASEGTGGSLLAQIFVLILRGVIALALIIFPIYLIYSLFSKEGRRWLLRNLIVFAAGLAVLILLQKQMTSVIDQIMNSMENMTGMQPPQLEPSGPAVAFDAAPPGWVSLVASLAIGLLAAAIVGLVAWFIWKSRVQKPSELEGLEDEARKAIDAIQSGGDLKDVILQCYRRMNEVLRVTRGIERGQAVTAEEFQTVLIQRGLPQSAVERLTRLFEDVRYGGISFNEEENNQAVDSLNAIITACRELRGEA